MTQNTNTAARTVANLTASILRTTGAVRDTYARALLAHAPVDLVAFLVGASVRHQAAENATAMAEAGLTRVMNAIGGMVDGGNNPQRAIDDVCRAATTYVHAIHHGGTDERAWAQQSFLDTTKTAYRTIQATIQARIA